MVKVGVWNMGCEKWGYVIGSDGIYVLVILWCIVYVKLVLFWLLEWVIGFGYLCDDYWDGIVCCIVWRYYFVFWGIES